MENLKNIEQEKEPKYRIVFTRHGERLPSGELRPDGIKHAKSKGKQWGSEAEVLKGYSSDHPSRRAFDTADISSSESEIKSPLSNKQYSTQEVENLEYSVLHPDFTKQFKKTKDIIEEETLKEYGLSTERDENGKLKINIEKLPLEDQLKIAPVRQKNQIKGFEYILKDKKVVHRLAMCLSHRLLKEINILERYKKYRDNMKQEPKKDVILNTVGHGVFTEALFKEAGRMNLDDDGEDGVDFNDPKVGGYLDPLESFEFEIDNLLEIPDMIPIKINRKDGSTVSGLFLDRKKMELLNNDYKEWVKNRQNNQK